METILDAKEILKEQSAATLELDKYRYIMEQVKNTDVATDKEFQKTFNSFYRIRRNEHWLTVYYQYFEKIKNETPTFEDIVTYLYQQSGNVEASFSSKMLAAISPEQPIWDQYVLQNLNLKLKSEAGEGKLKEAISLYHEIEDWYGNYLVSAH